MMADLEILLVADSLQNRYELFNALHRPWWKVLATDGGEGLNDCIGNAIPDLIVMDAEQLDKDAYFLVERMRGAFPVAGIVLLAPALSSAVRAIGYRVGVDVFITTPTAADELIAVIESLERRLQRTEAHYYILDRMKGKLSTPDQRVCKLTRSEQRLIELLVLSGSQMVSLEFLLQNMASRDDELFSQRALAVLISRLRAKSKTELDVDNLIVATRRQGYRLTVPLQLR